MVVGFSFANDNKFISFVPQVKGLFMKDLVEFLHGLACDLIRLDPSEGGTNHA